MCLSSGSAPGVLLRSWGCAFKVLGVCSFLAPGVLFLAPGVLYFAAGVLVPTRTGLIVAVYVEFLKAW